MQTTVSVNSPQARKAWATSLAVDYAKKRWFKKFTGRSENSIVQEKVELDQNAGDTIYFDLSMRLRGGMTTGDNVLQGNEESLTFMQDEVKIDQARKAVDTGGRMTKQRTVHDLRRIAKDRASDYCAEWSDEMIFIYLSGVAQGEAINEDSLAGVNVPFAGNPIEAPDADHLMYGGSGTNTSRATLTAADTMTRLTIERVTTRAAMLNARNPDVVAIRPIKIGAESHHVFLMNPEQNHDLRNEVGDSGWLQIQAAAGRRGSQNPIFSGQDGMVNNVSLHTHSNIRRFNDYGAGQNVAAARGLFLGRQAGTMAYGGGYKSRMSWEEELTDFRNKLAIAAGMICGVKKTRFKPLNGGSGSDFGVISVDTAATPV